MVVRGVFWNVAKVLLVLGRLVENKPAGLFSTIGAPDFFGVRNCSCNLTLTSRIYRHTDVAVPPPARKLDVCAADGGEGGLGGGFRKPPPRV